jgi:hypothetical protein
VVGVDGAHDALACFIGVDVHGVEVLADVVEGFEFRVDGGADVCLHAKVLVRCQWLRRKGLVDGRQLDELG